MWTFSNLETKQCIKKTRCTMVLGRQVPVRHPQWMDKEGVGLCRWLGVHSGCCGGYHHSWSGWRSTDPCWPSRNRWFSTHMWSARGRVSCNCFLSSNYGCKKTQNSLRHTSKAFMLHQHCQLLISHSLFLSSLERPFSTWT